MSARIKGRRWMRIRALVVYRDQGICWLCGLPGATSADHVIPLRFGGSNDFENLRAAHLRCNLARSARETNELRRQRSEYDAYPWLEPWQRSTARTRPRPNIQ